jgi:hypothetical protein
LDFLDEPEGGPDLRGKRLVTSALPPCNPFRA